MSRNYRFVRSYVGQVKAAILDWSGTTADKYVLAPAVAFVDVFEKHKVIPPGHVRKKKSGLCLANRKKSLQSSGLQRL